MINVDKLTDMEVEALLYDPDIALRPDQKFPDSDWSILLLLAGRGFGKGHAASFNIKRILENSNNQSCAFIGATSRDVTKVMVQGQSGFLQAFPKRHRPKYNKSTTRITCKNNNIIDLFESCAPERIRGNNLNLAWLDEFCSFKDPQYVLDMVLMALRRGKNPKLIITTTPKSIKPLKKLLEDSKIPENKIVVMKGTSFDNPFLPESTIQALKRTYEGTSIGRQELYAELLESTGSLFTRLDIERSRIPKHLLKDLKFKRIVVAIDPAISKTEKSDLTGIVVVGIATINGDDHAYVIEDATCKATPAEWGRIALSLYYNYNADRIVAEVNQGGDMVEHVIKTLDKSASYTAVRATRGKYIRAEPVAALYEQSKIHHVGIFKELEDQMVNYNPDITDDSPDRMDALVWAVYELLLKKQGTMAFGKSTSVL